MLLRFQVSNHRSIDHPVELSMTALDNDRTATRGFELLDDRILTTAAIYGPNASGKSNILDAISWLSRMVRTSLRSSDAFVPRDPHARHISSDQPSHFYLDLVIAGVRHRYELEVNNRTILYEGLWSYPKRRKRLLFERQGPTDIQFRRGLKGQGGTRELLTPTTLALSAAMRFDEPELRNAGLAISGIQSHGLIQHYPTGPDGKQSWEGTLRLFGTEKDQTSLFTTHDETSIHSPTAAIHLLRFADLGIRDVKIVHDNTGEEPRLQLVHHFESQAVPFELSEESEGTLAWLRLIEPALNALSKGQILLLDEIDASLHPELSARLIHLFQDSITNPLNAQLIFTSHDTSLLNVLNRDEVWLTDKHLEGATSLTPLSDFGGDLVRKSLNLERAYLQGRFGATPKLDQTELHQIMRIRSQS